ARRTILLVDDESDTREMLAVLLESQGYRVEQCGDGESALASATACHAQVAILDISMPDMDGYTLARRLSGLLGASVPPLIALTGHGQPEDLEASKNAGFFGHLTKPVEVQEL